MTKLDIARSALQKFPTAKKVAVMNFVGTLIGTNRDSELANLRMDAALYHWDWPTIEAIAFGVHTYYNSLN